MRPSRDASITVSDLCGVEPLRDGQAHQLIVKIPCCARGEGALTECVAGEGREWARGRGGGAQPRKKHQLIILMKKYCSAVHEVRLDLEETGQPREEGPDQVRIVVAGGDVDLQLLGPPFRFGFFSH